MDSFEEWASFNGEGKWRPSPGVTLEAPILHSDHPDLKDSYTVKVRVNEELTRSPDNIKEPTTENWPDSIDYPHFVVDVWAKVGGAGPHREGDERILSKEETSYDHVTTFETDRPGIEWTPEDYRDRVITALVNWVTRNR